MKLRRLSNRKITKTRFLMIQQPYLSAPLAIQYWENSYRLMLLNFSIYLWTLCNRQTIAKPSILYELWRVKKIRIFFWWLAFVFFSFSFSTILGTLIGTNDTKTTPLTQGTMVPCCKGELHKTRVLKRRQGFIATASLWPLQNATECGK